MSTIHYLLGGSNLKKNIIIFQFSSSKIFGNYAKYLQQFFLFLARSGNNRAGGRSWGLLPRSSSQSRVKNRAQFFWYRCGSSKKN